MVVFLTIYLAVSIAVGIGLIKGISVREIAAELFAHPQTFEEHLLELQGKQKQNFIQKQFALSKSILELTERSQEYGRYKRLSILFAVVGAGIGAVLLNPFLACVLAVAGLLGPLFIIQMTASSFQGESREELYSAISLITSSFERLDDFIAAVEENVSRIGAPVQDVLKELLRQYHVVDPSVHRAIGLMRDKIDQPIWRDWCDAAQDCIDDPGKKGTLRDVVIRCGQENRIRDELESMLRKPFWDMVKMTLIVVAPIPFVCFMFPDFTPILFLTWQGKAALAIVAGAILFGFYKAVHASRPLEFGKAAA